MQIKKFVASTLKEALDNLRTELGENALVLSSRVVDDKSAIGHRKVFEVVAGIDDNGSKIEFINSNSKNDKPSKDKFDIEIDKLKKAILSTKKIENSETKPSSKAGPVKENLLKLNETFERISKELINNDVSASIVKMITSQVSSQLPMMKNNNIDKFYLSTISSLILTKDFEVKKSDRTKIISVVGPTGVGKTTCIAKLALISKIIHKLNVGIISLDTYRLGALDQLKIFSEISEIDFLVAYKPEEISALLNKFKKKDLVFLDTAGRSQNNGKMLSEIQNSLAQIQIDETLLVLSLTNSTKNLFDVAKKFEPLKYNGIIFTKLDEAASFGNIINVVNKFNVPVKFLTNGQTIPDDIIAADSDFIANIIFTGKFN